MKKELYYLLNKTPLGFLVIGGGATLVGWLVWDKLIKPNLPPKPHSEDSPTQSDSENPENQKRTGSFVVWSNLGFVDAGNSKNFTGSYKVL